ncbi:helix-turn-helix transcriptional regulator [Rhodococcus spongiicola]|uniref:Helix-turn-helix transcriptional regulator n=1 Tax=Rhodococcus spongiicola TaxID=2487352 RepID=A0A3S3BJ84_9NOCA|nr:LuxR C-terminal-related transcriptional regulator [Rhodococcus spongiicola]RVW02620.1 helix-turn-helix transcriptional regulator [Rhodococcus spongiicola]
MPTPHPTADSDSYWAEVERRVDAALTSSGERTVLALDDVDRLDDPTIETRILASLHHHERLHVVVTTRTAEVFGGAGLLDVDHAPIPPEELLFTAHECRAALLARGIELPPHLSKTVHDVTSGFPPLVQAAMTVMRPFSGLDHGRELPCRALEQAIDRYVEHAILDDPELSGLREFLHTIAAASTVTATAAELLTGDDDVAERLRELETAGVLTRSPWPRDDEWTFVAPVRDSLMRAVRRETPEGPLPASSDLAKWFRDRGNSSAALEHAVEAQDWDLTIGILKANWVELVSRRFHLVRETLTSIPAEAADADLSIRAGRELFLTLGSDATQLPDPASLPASSARSSDPAEAADALAVGTVQSLIQRVNGNFADAADIGSRMSALGDRLMAAQHDGVAGCLPLLRVQWGVTHQLHGDLGGASVQFRRAYNSNRSIGSDFVARNAAGNLALNYALSGELGHAEAWLDKERRYNDESAWVTKMVRVGGLVASALVAIDRMELDVAAKVLAVLGDLPDDEELWAFALYAHCQLALVTCQPATGLDRIRRTTAVYDRWLTASSLAAPLLAAAEADLHLALGHGNETWVTLENAPGRGPWTTIAHARMELSSDRPGEVLADCARPAVSECPYPHIRMESALLQAAAHLHLANEAQAQTMLRRAVALFDQTGMVRPFVSLPAGWIARLSELDVELPPAWTSAVPAPGAAVYPDRIQLVNLSDRESAVLDALVSTPSVAAIAGQLFVSQNTVKTQLRSLYRKLGVHSRADALLTATHLGLITRQPEA